ncbi:MAG: M15 family metallopeptidase [Akkermansiaceae bacterium]
MKLPHHLITLALPLICLTICYCAPTTSNKPVPPIGPVTPPQYTDAELPISNNPKYAAANLISITEVDPTILIDLQYTRPTTVAKSPLYPEKFPALLRPETALRLKHANDIVKQFDLRIKVWDAYRPPSAQWNLYEASGRNDEFVANPGNSPSQHSCGTAVDITLVTKSGKPAPMPTGFDSFTPQAHSYFNHSDPTLAKNLKLLQYAMHKSGFHPLPAEWWHYIDINYKNYPNTIPLKKIQ